MGADHPATNASFLAGGALVFDNTAGTDIGPIGVLYFIIQLAGIVIGQMLASRTDVNILGGIIGKVRTVKPASCCNYSPPCQISDVLNLWGNESG